MLRVYAQCADAHCPPLTRPHNLHYVGMPAAQGSLARLPLRALCDRDGPTISGDPSVALVPITDRCSIKKEGSLWTFRLAPCSPYQGQTLTRLRSALGGPGPQRTRSRS